MVPVVPVVPAGVPELVPPWYCPKVGPELEEPAWYFPIVGPELGERVELEEPVFGLTVLPPDTEISATLTPLPGVPRVNASTPTMLRPLGVRLEACTVAMKPVAS